MHIHSSTVPDIFRAVAKTLIGGGGGIFIYSGSARLTSFEINFISKETSRAEPEYMNIHPPISALATALDIFYCYLQQNKQSHRHLLYSVMSHVVLFACIYTQ